MRQSLPRSVIQSPRSASSQANRWQKQLSVQDNVESTSFFPCTHCEYAGLYYLSK